MARAFERTNGLFCISPESPSGRHASSTEQTMASDECSSRHYQFRLLETVLNFFYTCQSRSPPHLKKRVHCVCIIVCYASHFALESSLNLFSLSERSPLPSVPPACLGTLIVSASPSVRFLRPGSWKCPRVPARGSVPVYTWGSVLLDMKSLARCFPRVVFGTACGRPSAIISVSFPYKSWALSAEMPKNLSFKSSLFL